MVSNYLWSALGHYYVTACKGRGPGKWWNKGKNCGFMEKEEFALKCCSVVTPVQNFNAEDMTVYYWIIHTKF